VQNLRYTYDPVGNITHIRDDAQQAVFFHNRRVEPSADYTYDALHRLIEATGREHLGQAGGSLALHSWNDVPRVGLPREGDGQAMGRYAERYVYDEVGNILEMRHRGSAPAHPGWKRCYQYAADSSRLLSTGGPRDAGDPGNACATHYAPDPVHPERYAYDAHGNRTAMPHLRELRWDFADRLQATVTQAVGPGGTAETTWYVYDSTGQRVRKVTERAPGQVKDERIYPGGFEIYRRHGADPLVRETLHVMDDTRRIALVETRILGKEPDAPAQPHPLPVRQSSRLVQPGAGRSCAGHLVRGIHAVRQHLVPGGAEGHRAAAQALPLHREGAGRGERAVLPRGEVLRGVAGEVGEL
jgi:YD repeat-containing protein